MSEPADVYCAWIDECSRLNKQTTEKVKEQDLELSQDEKQNSESELEGSLVEDNHDKFRKHKIRKLIHSDED